MNRAFWQQRWERGEIGWHEAEINRHLAEHWPTLQIPEATRVLVPLCGKSLDMIWLAGRGHQVVGVELSRIAADAFCAENGLTPRITDEPPFVRYVVDEVEILVGDYFDLRKAHVEGVGAVYDRASLIALPPDMRRRYARHLAALLPPGVSSLLVTLDYDPVRMSGPPFAVTDAEVHALFAETFTVEGLAEFDVLSENLRFRDRGLEWLNEHVYRLCRRGG